MPKKQTPLAELGSVQPHSGVYRASMQYRDDASKRTNIYGPDRLDEARAKADLAQIRAAGAVGKTREEGLAIMAAEARRIQESAKYEAEISAAEMRLRAEDEAEEGFVGFVSGSDSEPDDEPWIKDYYLSKPAPKEVASTPPSQKQKLSPIEATAALKIFRPFRSQPADLEHILECRADPNYTLDPDDVSPLRKVILLARAEHVVKMRQLLFDYGATECDYERERWVSRQRSDFCEEIRLKAEREMEDERRYSPTAAAMEMAI